MWKALGNGKAFSPLKALQASVLCRRDSPVNSARAVIGWWEVRRIPFNLIVGIAGLITCVVVGVAALGAEILFHSEFGLPDPPGFALIGMIIYAILANVCFTGGWIAELVVREVWPQEADRFATLSFSLGMVFSVLLTLAPAVLVAAGGFFKLVKHLLG
jgi:hypothetical protein